MNVIRLESFLGRQSFTVTILIAMGEATIKFSLNICSVYDRFIGSGRGKGV